MKRAMGCHNRRLYGCVTAVIVLLCASRSSLASGGPQGGYSTGQDPPAGISEEQHASPSPKPGRDAAVQAGVQEEQDAAGPSMTLPQLAQRLLEDAKHAAAARRAHRGVPASPAEGNISYAYGAHTPTACTALLAHVGMVGMEARNPPSTACAAPHGRPAAQAKTDEHRWGGGRAGSRHTARAPTKYSS